MNKLDEIIAMLKEFPNSTRDEIAKMLDRKPSDGLSNDLVNLYRRGVLLREKIPNKGPSVRKMVYAFSVNPGPAIPVAEPRRKLRLKSPTSNGYEAQIADLKARVAELGTWQANAIKRYPDLAVAPVILRAREIVARIFSAANDAIKVNHVKAGQMDNTPIMQATIAGLEETV